MLTSWSRHAARTPSGPGETRTVTVAPKRVPRLFWAAQSALRSAGDVATSASLRREKAATVFLARLWRSVFWSAFRRLCSSGPSSVSAATASVATVVTSTAPTIRPRRPRAPRGERPPNIRQPPRAAPSRSSEPVSGASNGQDVARLFGLGLELLTQVANVDVDRARVAIRAVAPDRAQQLLAVEQPAGIRHQRIEQLELRKRQLHGRPVDCDLALGAIKRDRPDDEHLVS